MKIYLVTHINCNYFGTYHVGVVVADNWSSAEDMAMKLRSYDCDNSDHYIVRDLDTTREHVVCVASEDSAEDLKFSYC